MISNLGPIHKPTPEQKAKRSAEFLEQAIRRELDLLPETGQRTVLRSIERFCECAVLAMDQAYVRRLQASLTISEGAD